MATKTKAASKPAAKKAPRKRTPSPPKPVEIESVTVEADQSGATLVINGKPHTLGVQAFLGLRRDINDQAAGLVH